MAQVFGGTSEKGAKLAAWMLRSRWSFAAAISQLFDNAPLASQSSGGNTSRS